MSRMTKFLKQTCVFESAKRNSKNEVQLDKFGEIIYEAPINIKCRRERTIKDIQTNTGAILKSSTRYYTDEANIINADDKFDGKIILEVEEYINQAGKVEGYMCYV